MSSQFPILPLSGGGGSRGYSNIDTHLPQADLSGYANAAQNLEQLGNAASQYDRNNIALNRAKLQEQERIAAKAAAAQEKLDQQSSIKTFTDFELADQQRQTAFMQEYAGDPKEFNKTNMQAQDILYKSFQDKKDLTEGAKQFLGQQYDQYKVRAQDQSLNQQASLQGQVAKSNIELAARNIINTTLNDPTKYEESQQKILQLAETMHGMMPPQALAELTQSVSDQNTLAMIRAKALANPRQTLQEIKEGQYNGLLTLDESLQDLTVLTRQIQAEDKQIAEQNKATISSQFDDHVASLLQTGVPVLSRQQVLSTGDPELIRKYDTETRYAKMGYNILKGHESLPTDQQLALLKDIAPTPGAKDYNDQLQAYQFLQNSIMQQAKTYNTDPVAASIQNDAQVAKAYHESDSAGMRASIQYQLNKHTPISQIRALSQDQADQNASQIKALIDAGQTQAAYDVVKQMKAKYMVSTLDDGRTSWDIAKSQIFSSKAAKIPDEFIQSMQYSDIPEGADIFRASQKGMTGKGGYSESLDSHQIKAIKTGMHSAVAAYNQSVSGIPGFADKERLDSKTTLATKYAASLVANGMSVNDAVKKAKNVMYPYNIIRNGRQDLVIPKNLNGTHLDSGKISHNLNGLLNFNKLYGFVRQGESLDGQGRALHSAQGMPPTKSPYLSVAIKAAQKYGIDPTIFARQIYQESGFNPNASNNVIGMGGIAQISQRYHPEMAGRTGDPYASLDYAAKIMSNYVHTYKGMGFDNNKAMSLALSTYNAGAGSVRSSGYNVPNIPETQQYVKNILGVGSTRVRRFVDTGEARRYAESVSRTGIWKMDPGMASATLYAKNNDGSLSPVFNQNDELYQFKLTDLQRGTAGSNIRPMNPAGSQALFSNMSGIQKTAARYVHSIPNDARAVGKAIRQSFNNPQQDVGQTIRNLWNMPFPWPH